MTLEQMKQEPGTPRAQEHRLTPTQLQEQLRQSMAANNHLQQASKEMLQQMRDRTNVG